MKKTLTYLKILRAFLWPHFLFLLGREVYREYYYRDLQIEFILLAIVSAILLQFINSFIIDIKYEINNKNQTL